MNQNLGWNPFLEVPGTMLGCLLYPAIAQTPYSPIAVVTAALTWRDDFNCYILLVPEALALGWSADPALAPHPAHWLLTASSSSSSRCWRCWAHTPAQCYKCWRDCGCISSVKQALLGFHWSWSGPRINATGAENQMQGKGLKEARYSCWMERAAYLETQDS